MEWDLPVTATAAAVKAGFAVLYCDALLMALFRNAIYRRFLCGAKGQTAQQTAFHAFLTGHATFRKYEDFHY